MTGILIPGAAGVPDWLTDDAFHDGWVDAWERYGLSVGAGGRGELMAYAPMKQPTGSNVATRHGVAYWEESIGRYNERMLSLNVHFSAPDEQEFMRRYDLFWEEVLKYGYLQVRHQKCNQYFHFRYEDCKNFREFRMHLAKYTLTVSEPHPDIRDARNPHIIQI